MVVMPRFLDFEASSLSSQSYPIEIAWSDNYGNIESHLINPMFVSHWKDWSILSQEIHGISREQLIDEGMHPEFVCQRMEETLSRDECIYADGGDYDVRWTNVLFSESSSGMQSFKVMHSDIVMLSVLAKIEDDSNKRQQLFSELKILARKNVGGIHRAEVDVQYLIELYKLCISMQGI